MGCASELGCAADRSRGTWDGCDVLKGFHLSADAMHAGMRGHAKRPALEKRLQIFSFETGRESRWEGCVWGKEQ